MSSCFPDTVKKFIVKPMEAFKGVHAATMGEAYRYYVLLLIIYIILSGIVMTILSVDAFNQALAMLATIPGMEFLSALSDFTGFIATLSIFWVYIIFLIGLFSIFVNGFFLHLFVLMMGGEEGLGTTIKTMMFAYTPIFILGWIPYVNIIGSIWTVVLIILGLRETQHLDTGRAVAVILIPIILMVIFGILLASLFVAFLGGMQTILATGV